MIVVVLSFPDGQRQEVLLAGIPRVGDHVHLAANGSTRPSLVVEHVLWAEGVARGQEPTVTIGVRVHKEGPRG